MNAAYKRLVAAESEGYVGRKIVVRLALLAVECVAVAQPQVNIRIVLAPEQSALIGKIAVADRHGEGHRYAAVVVIFVIIMAHTPRVAAQYAVERTDGAHQRTGKLTQKAAHAALAVVVNEVRHAVGYLAYAYSAYSCSH